MSYFIVTAQINFISLTVASLLKLNSWSTFNIHDSKNMPAVLDAMLIFLVELKLSRLESEIYICPYQSELQGYRYILSVVHIHDL